MPRVGIVGAYNAGFICDEWLYEALSKHILNIPGWEVMPYPNKVEPDCFLIGGGTILGTPLSCFNNNKPFAVFGAGYRGPENIEVLKKAISVKVRGLHTVNKLAEHGIKAIPCGDVINLLHIPVVPRTYEKGFVPRSLQWNQSKEYKDWYSNQQADIVINLHQVENDAANLKAIVPKTKEEALNLVLSCKRLASARLHPFLISLIAGIPCDYFDVEFNKGEDAVSGIPYWRGQLDSFRDTMKLLGEGCR